MDLAHQTDAGGRLNWLLHVVDNTILRAPPACSGGKKGGPEAEALGRSQGGCSTKIHLRAEGHSKPFSWLLTPGPRHEAPLLVPQLKQGAVKRPGGGRPKRRPGRLVGDKAYSSRAIRRYLRRHGIHLTLPRKRDERCPGPFDRAMYRLRNQVERLINRLKQFRRIATRSAKRAENYHTMLLIATILLWL